MCGHFITIPLDELYEILEGMRVARAAARDVFPKGEAPVLVAGKTRLETQVMRWGYPVSWQKGVVFNTRCETALAPGGNMWTESARQRRCLVPSYGFFEPHDTEKAISPKTGREIKAQYLFNLPGSQVVFMAGVYQEGCFSVMTTAANRWMKPVHPRMPVVLLPHEYDQWLHGDWAALTNRGDIPLEKRPA